MLLRPERPALWMPAFPGQRRFFIGTARATVTCRKGAAALHLPTFVQTGTAINNGTAAASHTAGYTAAVGPGSNRALLLVGCTKHNSDTITFTYNAVAGTQLAYNRYTTPSPDFVAFIYGWFGANVPNDGASHDFVVDGANDLMLMARPVEFINVAAGAPLQVGTPHAANTDNFSIAFTGVAATSLLVAAFIGAGTGGTAPAGTEQEFVDINNVTPNNHLAGYYKRPGTDHAGGSVSMACSHTSANGTLVACELGMAA